MRAIVLLGLVCCSAPPDRGRDVVVVTHGGKRAEDCPPPRRRTATEACRDLQATTDQLTTCSKRSRRVRRAVEKVHLELALWASHPSIQSDRGNASFCDSKTAEVLAALEKPCSW